jgi:hypothetical protein
MVNSTSFSCHSFVKGLKSNDSGAEHNHCGLKG